MHRACPVTGIEDDSQANPAAHMPSSRAGQDAHQPWRGNGWPWCPRCRAGGGAPQTQASLQHVGRLGLIELLPLCYNPRKRRPNMHSIKTALLAALTIATATPAMAVYKCKDHLGRTVYQEKACDTKATSEKVDTTPSASGVIMESGYGKIRIGMTPEQVTTAWGKPDKSTTPSPSTGTESSGSTAGPTMALSTCTLRMAWSRLSHQTKPSTPTSPPPGGLFFVPTQETHQCKFMFADW